MASGGECRSLAFPLSLRLRRHSLLGSSFPAAELVLRYRRHTVSGPLRVFHVHFLKSRPGGVPPVARGRGDLLRTYEYPEHVTSLSVWPCHRRLLATAVYAYGPCIRGFAVSHPPRISLVCVLRWPTFSLDLALRLSTAALPLPHPKSGNDSDHYRGGQHLLTRGEFRSSAPTTKGVDHRAQQALICRNNHRCTDS